MGAYFRPTDLDAALAILAPDHLPPGLVVVAGGTDHFPSRVDRPPALAILDITAIPSLAGIAEQDGHWRIGAATRWRTIVQDDGLPPQFDALRQAGREIGGVQIQNMGTIGGNLCNASPAADGIPVLLAMNARVELYSRSGRSEMALAEFIHGKGRTALQPGQLLTAILVPGNGVGAGSGTALSAFRKLGARRYLVISIAMVGIVLRLQRGHIASAGIAVGACSPVACRLPELEGRLQGRALAGGLGNLVRAEDLGVLSPVDDIRGSAAYRLDAVAVLLRRMLEDLAVAREGPG